MAGSEGGENSSKVDTLQHNLTTTTHKCWLHLLWCGGAELICWNFLYGYETWLRGLLCQHAEYIMNVTFIIKEPSWTQLTSGTRHSLPVLFFFFPGCFRRQCPEIEFSSLYHSTLNCIPHSQTRLMEEKYPTYRINKTVNAVRKTVQLSLICAQCFTLLSRRRKVLVVILRIGKSVSYTLIFD